jgi:outer membrane protein OmpA-like peptidoglycan-associated protein
MSDPNDDAQNVALAVIAGVVALVVAGVIALAAGTIGASATRAKPVAAAAPADEALRVERVYFEIGSDALSAEAQTVLAGLADAAREQDGTVVLISGFHDASGDPARNAELAKQRALAVRHALEANGVALERLVLDKPVLVLGGTDAREARRVELRLRR